MTKTILRRTVLFPVLTILSLSIMISPFSALAHEGEVHDTEEGVVKKMEAIVTLLEYLKEIYEIQIEAMGKIPVSKVVHDDEHEVHSKAYVEGIHIMADGTVMLGNGEVAVGATINDDGMVVLADGALATPVMDMRADNHTDIDEYEVNSIHFEIHDNMTHVHYTNGEGELSTFFVDYEITERDTIIDAIVSETGLDRVVVEEIADFDTVVQG